MAWRAARSLLVLQQQLQAGAPRAKPPATGANEWGLIGDAAHDPTSDHSPHDFPGWGNDIVTAADFPNRPGLGLDAHKVLDDIRRARDPRAKYGISNGQIWSNHGVLQGGVWYDAWTWRPYRRSDGSRYADEHYTHGHLSVVGDARADGTQPWPTIGAPVVAAGNSEDEDEMSPFANITIAPAGEVTSVSVPGGSANARPTWFCCTNDTGAADGVTQYEYGLRVYYSDGKGWHPLGATGLHKASNGVTLSVKLPDVDPQMLPGGVRGLSVMRAPIDAAGAVVDPKSPQAAGLEPYAGPLTFCLERS